MDYTEKQLREGVVASKSVREVCRFLGYKDSQGSKYRNVRNHILSLGLDTGHFNPYGRSNSGPKRIPLDEYLVVNSSIPSSRLKKYLYEAGLLEEICFECGQLPMWNGRPLVLQLDHINGIHSDNRLENLRILCPYCHTQTETYVGKNIRRVKPTGDGTSFEPRRG